MPAGGPFNRVNKLVSYEVSWENRLKPLPWGGMAGGGQTNQLRGGKGSRDSA